MATKVKTGVIDSGAITSALITDASITADDLHTTLDLTGKTVTVATASASDNDTSVASTAYVTTAIANLADSAPSTLNTLNELAAALGDDANFSTTVTNSIATKLPLAGGTMTGNIAHASDFTIDAGGDIILDADGADVILKDGGTSFLEFDKDGSNARLKNPIADGDIKIQGVDGASTITALSLDMSEAGYATFNNNVRAASFSVGAGPTSELLFLSGAGHNGHGTTNARSVASFNTTGQNAGLWFGARNDETTGIIGTRTATGNLAFETYNSGWGERMRITYEGNVGIGTDNPQDQLHILDGDLGIENSSGRRYRFIAETDGSFTVRDQTAASGRLNIDTSGNLNIQNGSLYIRDDEVLATDGSSAYLKAPSAIYLYPQNVNRGNISAAGVLTLTSASGTHTLGSSATNLVADFVSTDGTAAIRLRDSGGNVELSTSSGNFQIQPAGGSAVFVCDTAGNLSQIQKITTTGTSNDEGIYLGANHRIYGGTVRAFEASTAASGTVQLGEGMTSGKVLISAPRFDYPAEQRCKDDNGILRYTKAVTVGESATTVLTITKSSYSYFIGGTLTLILQDSGSPWGVYYLKRTIVGRKATYQAGNDMGYSLANSESHSNMDYVPTFSDSDSRTSGQGGGTISIKVANGSGKGSSSCKVIFDGYLAGGSLS